MRWHCALTFLAATLLAACNRGDPSNSAAPTQSNGTKAASQTASAQPFTRIVLRDVQGLFGGQDVWVEANGRVVVQIVRMPEVKRFEMKVTQADVAALQESIRAHHFEALTVQLV